ncbi:hypothetical protein GCM10018793_12200 [Streptomyces sulfonofaciens]|uniref:Uncharacterized protein n=1 Tax=Streptomyces sulfonofaciens TaxID=68272 RepID=A0A919FX18_9ACTN|nr:hypothetical protein GCM10018793_12200 [Streptomyces sulfonofaciens]
MRLFRTARPAGRDAGGIVGEQVVDPVRMGAVDEDADPYGLAAVDDGAGEKHTRIVVEPRQQVTGGPVRLFRSLRAVIAGAGPEGTVVKSGRRGTPSAWNPVSLPYTRWARSISSSRASREAAPPRRCRSSRRAAHARRSCRAAGTAENVATEPPVVSRPVLPSGRPHTSCAIQRNTLLQRGECRSATAKLLYGSVPRA